MWLMKIEVTLTQYQRSKDSEYEEIADNSNYIHAKVSTTNHFQYKFQIKLPEWLVEANRVGNLFDISLILRKMVSLDSLKPLELSQPC
ncbi:hypothetical protein [Paenibacillus sp. USHLN196]|uniref:hypothetical protein n=1 Tax=Paenibacillus sp. USHLN196 TaxID=3081291 RepID=UPI0030197542